MQRLETSTRDKQKYLSDELIEKQLELSGLRGKVAEYERRLELMEKDCSEQKELISTLKEDYQQAKTEVRDASGEYHVRLCKLYIDLCTVIIQIEALTSIQLLCVSTTLSN